MAMDTSLFSKEGLREICGVASTRGNPIFTTAIPSHPPRGGSVNRGLLRCVHDANTGSITATGRNSSHVRAANRHNNIAAINGSA